MAPHPQQQPQPRRGRQPALQMRRAGVSPPYAPLPSVAPPVLALVLGALHPLGRRLHAVLLAPDGEPAAAVLAPPEVLRGVGRQRPWEPRPGDLVACLPPGGDRLPYGLLLARVPSAHLDAAVFLTRVHAQGRARDPGVWDHLGLQGHVCRRPSFMAVDDVECAPEAAAEAAAASLGALRLAWPTKP